MNVTRVPVLIVGAGVGGLAMSALLAKDGVHSLLVERRAEVFVYPKARNVGFRTFEILRRLGVSDAVHAVAEHPSDTVVKATVNGAIEEPAVAMNALVSGMVSEFEGLSPEPSVQFCPQSRTEPILLAHARHHGSQVRYGTELSFFEQDDTGITAVVRERDSGKSETLRADYLVAADGVHSPVRETLGISTSGSGVWPLYSILIYFRAPWRKLVPNLGDGDVLQIRNAEVDGLFVSTDSDLGVFVITYFPERGETAEQFTPDRCHELLLTAIGEQIPVEIIDIMRWQPAEQVADQFQCGRVFLVGDSAHTIPPFRAGGANIAIQSADNLAWKLAAVVNGVAGPELLSTYHTERHPIGRFCARQSCTGPQLEALRFDNDSVTLPPEEKASNFAVVIGYQYRSAAIVNGDAAAADPGTVALVDDLHAQPGTRIPHVWVHRDGQRISTLDLLAPGFTLLTGADGVRWTAAATSSSDTLGVPITAHYIDDTVDPDGAWAAASGLKPDGAVLVRPDDFVGWRADSLPADPDKELRQALSAILARS
ncbi:FAD-dependent monooxygenase [Mycobacterium terramassiliense]|uniref:2-polyprenyl-6-methoxyphenol hydroxylase and related FAD-dependent oxidoreductases n=1 Tax=Mycobacterium terramassiliense TaxID=1841859 RepID=A0A2U3NGD6_9MYCO|nr:FAD-dependent monooxygenase [Mycobacterium terramassiliense]SPM30567.1 2-polyprenyl-6-methoxyphenol hydroxylase and related FAD-dependent oxidoreductases [Mycobacterium terramassiliense]